MLLTAAERCNQVYTPAYASPEIIVYMNGHCPGMPDGANDIWALGVTLHQILTCASLNWRLAFGSVSAATPADLTSERLGRAQASLTREHTLWVRLLNSLLSLILRLTSSDTDT